jgi:prepilin peptidase CpaA
MNQINGPLWLALALGLTAVWTDLRNRTIPNWIPLAALTGGLAWHGLAGGWQGLGASALGAAGGFLVFIVFFLLGGMGGGDVKLMGGFGALLGYRSLLAASFWVALAGGLFAVAVIVWRKLRAGKSGSQQEAHIPYAPAIALGVWIALLGKA